MVFFSERFRDEKMRKFITENVELPLVKILNIVDDHLPEPSKENTNIPNTSILVDTCSLFRRYEGNDIRAKALNAIFKYLIIKYDHDQYYRDRFDWFVEEINKRGWQPRLPEQPTRNEMWKEPLEVS